MYTFIQNYGCVFGGCSTAGFRSLGPSVKHFCESPPFPYGDPPTHQNEGSG